MAKKKLKFHKIHTLDIQTKFNSKGEKEKNPSTNLYMTSIFVEEKEYISHFKDFSSVKRALKHFRIINHLTHCAVII